MRTSRTRGPASTTVSCTANFAGAADSAFPGVLIFTSLSQDVVAHQVTHAILPGMGIGATSDNLDNYAFHEAFCDMVSLFQHFWKSEVLTAQIAAIKGKLDEPQPAGRGGVAVRSGARSKKRGCATSSCNRKTINCCRAARIRHAMPWNRNRMTAAIFWSVRSSKHSRRSSRRALRTCVGSPPKALACFPGRGTPRADRAVCRGGREVGASSAQHVRARARLSAGGEFYLWGLPACDHHGGFRPVSNRRAALSGRPRRGVPRSQAG